MASAQAQLPPPNYSLDCAGQTLIDVDPETATPSTNTIDCIVTNQESYSIELSLQSEAGHLETILSVSELTVGGNAEENFQITVEAVDGMKMTTLSVKTTTEVTKTGELEYSDNEPKEHNGLIEILQYAGFKVEPHQSETDYSLADEEYFELGYTISNTGNWADKFFISLDSVTTRICDSDREVENVGYYSECDGGYYVPPISNDCNEVLATEFVNGFFAMEFVYEQREDFYFRVSSSISNSSCWPKSYNGDLELSFDMTFSISSEFHKRYENSGELQISDATPYYLHYSVHVKMSDEDGVRGGPTSHYTPGFETSCLLLCAFFSVIVHNRKIALH